ncbi:MAG: hypothetical protein V4492_08895, partial [Chlamydiota bacterium]
MGRDIAERVQEVVSKPVENSFLEGFTAGAFRPSVHASLLVQPAVDQTEQVEDGDFLQKSPLSSSSLLSDGNDEFRGIFELEEDRYLLNEDVDSPAENTVAFSPSSNTVAFSPSSNSVVFSQP